MFDGVKRGCVLIKESILVFNRYPTLLLPLLITWTIYAPIILYLKFWFNWEAYSFVQILIIVFGVIFIFAFLLAFSCTILLELIEQIEKGERISFLKSFSNRFGKDLLTILPIVIIWTVIWFILVVIEALLSKKKRTNENESFSAENAAKTLAGYGSFSISGAFFEALQKGVRMIIFLILPAIVWDNLEFIPAIKKGLAVLKAHLSEFATGFLLTEGASTILYFVPGLLIYLSSKEKITLPDSVWFIIIIYLAFAWSYSMYLEQMFAAQLYMWHMKWEEAVVLAQKEGKLIPSIQDVQKPSLLDNSPDLIPHVAPPINPTIPMNI